MSRSNCPSMPSETHSTRLRAARDHDGESDRVTLIRDLLDVQ
jgi:hypothetical protein